MLFDGVWKLEVGQDGKGKLLSMHRDFARNGVIWSLKGTPTSRVHIPMTSVPNMWLRSDVGDIIKKSNAGVGQSRPASDRRLTFGLACRHFESQLRERKS